MCFGPATAVARGHLRSDWTFVRKRLRAAGVTASTTEALRRVYNPKHLERTVELNVLLFLRRADDHGPQATDQGHDRVLEFVGEHPQSFARARERYGVDPLVIASLLYIESRFGRNQGHFHVASVYLDLIQAARPEVVAHLMRAAPKFRPVITTANRREIARRAEKKAAWAAREVLALEKIHQADARALARWRGSFAGALGLPQFLPSSYLEYAKSSDPLRAADLARADDAILSVANYLRRSGWRASDPTTFQPALFKYNQSQDYARAILRLASASDARDRRPSAEDTD